MKQGTPKRRTPLRSMSAKRRKRFDGPTAPRERHPMALHPVERAGVYAGTTSGPAPKEAVVVSAAYENAVRALGYCVRCGWIGRPQFCHTDQGKGAGIKTDVRQGWAGCPGCHALLGGHAGGGRMPKEQRRAEEDQLAEITRAELVRRGTWPKSVPMWSE